MSVGLDTEPSGYLRAGAVSGSPPTSGWLFWGRCYDVYLFICWSLVKDLHLKKCPIKLTLTMFFYHRKLKNIFLIISYSCIINSKPDCTILNRIRYKQTHLTLTLHYIHFPSCENLHCLEQFKTVKILFISRVNAWKVIVFATSYGFLSQPKPALVNFPCMSNLSSIVSRDLRCR